MTTMKMLRRTGIGLTAFVLAAAVPAAVPAPAAAADQTYWAPADESYELTGHGYGHGRGMSQYGARGAALEGLSWREIVAFYYPRTDLKEMRNSGWMRVLLTANTVDFIRVSPRAGLRVKDLETGTVTRLDQDGVTRWELKLRGDGRVGLRSRTADGWSFRRAFEGEAEFFARGPLTLWRNGSDATRYRARLRTTHTDGSLRTINALPLEAYLRGVVPAEMPATWPGAAVSAQAVAARTYAVRHRQAHRQRSFHVDDTISYQVYRGFDSEHPDANRAVTATAGAVVTHDGAPALTEFSSSSGGLTDGSAIDYQVIKNDPYDASSGNPNATWSETLSATTLERRYSLGDLQRVVVTRRGGCGGSNCDWGGRIRSAELVGTDRTVTVDGDSLRMNNGLRSTWFTFGLTPIIERHRSMGGASSVVGAPRAAEYAVGGGTAQRFESGRMFHHPETGAHETHGPIAGKYFQRKGAAGMHGFPTTDVRTAGGDPQGRRQGFQRGQIFHHPDAGTHETFGHIAGKYFRRKGAAGMHGFPTTGVRTAGGDPQGRRQGFQQGQIFFHPDAGAHEVHGPIAGAYYGRRGAAGPLGYPTTDVRKVRGGLRSDFEGGWIRWDRETDTTTVVVN